MQKTTKKYFPIFVLPTLIAFFIAFVIPFFWGVYLSFCKFKTIKKAEFVGFDNYIAAFKNDNFVNSFKFTVIFAIVAVIVINVAAFTLAVLLTQKVKGTNLFRTVFFMPNLIGGIVLGYIWNSIFNSILKSYSTTIANDAKYGFWGLIILMSWQLIGYMMIIYIAGLQNVPTDLKEAAQIDGASRWQQLRKITIPMVMPSITICLFLSVSNCFKLFDQNLSLTGGAPQRKTAMLALDIFDTFYGNNTSKGIGQAKAVLFFLLVGIIALTQLFFTRRKEVEQ
ncbi:MAG: sugar ABC transporter permease [Clostridiales bacterium]|nr:sugar ABC transporter permease [Clostridiales bacterium]